MNNPEAHELINSCHRLSGKIDDLNSELDELEDELLSEKRKLRTLVNQSGGEPLIVEGYGLNYKVCPFGETLVRIDLSD